MRKLFLFLLLFASTMANAQIFSSKMVLDKFNDVISVQGIKALITSTDSTVVIEEKGKDPVVYYINNYLNSRGTKEEPVNLTDDIYGYETCMCCVLDKDLAVHYNEVTKAINEKDKNKKDEILVNLIYTFDYFIYHKVITTQYTGNYITEFYIVMLPEEGGRIIYAK